MRVEHGRGNTVGVTSVVNRTEARGCVAFKMSDYNDFCIHMTMEERVGLVLTLLSGGDPLELLEEVARNPKARNMLKLLLENSEKFQPCLSCGAINNVRDRKICSSCSRYLEAE